MPKVISQKEEKRQKLFREMQLPKDTRAIIVIDIGDADITSCLQDAASSLSIKLVPSSEMGKDIEGYDACILDASSHIDLVSAVQHGVVPIVSLDHALSQSFREFDPMKFEGNAFIFARMDRYLIIEKLIRYLENIRYAGDKRTLLNNLAKTF